MIAVEAEGGAVTVGLISIADPVGMPSNFGENNGVPVPATLFVTLKVLLDTNWKMTIVTPFAYALGVDIELVGAMAPNSSPLPKRPELTGVSATVLQTPVVRVVKADHKVT